MTDQEKSLFEKLSTDRKESATILEKESMKGVRTSVVEKYSDQAHFIYELIQNADDVFATEARFELFEDRLVFIHNGTRHFKVTDVDNETEDTKNGTLGDLNSITSIANSNKNHASIGKFGVGFKAVFQYTTTPYIYGPNLAFKIERFIVPVLIEGDCNLRGKNETAFIFPFNHPDRDAQLAYKDILNKLESLVFPTLFMKNLKKVTYRSGDISGEYVKKVKAGPKLPGTLAQKLEFVSGRQKEKNKMWLFTRETEDNYRYSCGFLVDKKGKLVKNDYYAFCFFPTKKETNLNFIINAPFLLTDSREGIKAFDDHNVEMIKLLADLAADCFVYLRDIGIQENIKIIDDDILDYLPIKKELYTPRNEGDDISFLPFYSSIKKVFSEEDLWPTASGYTNRQHAYMAYWSVMTETFNDSQMAIIVGDEDAKWILPTKGYETLYRARDGKSDYLNETADNPSVTDIKLIGNINADFIETQSVKWLFDLYGFILSTANRVDASKTIPIFRDTKGNAVAAYDKAGKAILFLDDEDSHGYTTISDELLKNQNTLDLVERLKIKAPELKDKIYNKILKKQSAFSKADFKAFIDYYISLVENGASIQGFINDIRRKPFMLFVSEDSAEHGMDLPKNVYYPNETLKKYFYGTGTVRFVDIEEYEKTLTKREQKYLDDFLCAVGVSSHVRRVETELSRNDIRRYSDIRQPEYTRYCRWFDYGLDRYESVLSIIEDTKDIELSLILWNELVLTEKRGKRAIDGVCKYFYRSERGIFFTGFCHRKLLGAKWLYTKNGNWEKPGNLNVQDLDSRYDLSSDGARNLLDLLDINDEHPEYEDYDDEIRRKLERDDLYARIGLHDIPEEDLIRILSSYKSEITHSEKTENDGESNSDGNGSLVDGESTDKIMKDLISRVKKSHSEKKEEKGGQGTELDTTETEENLEDSDEITKALVDYSDKIEKAKKECEVEISRLVLMEEAQNKAKTCEKYSYGWFSSLLQLEAMENGDEKSNSRAVSISFSKVEREENSVRTLLLKHPDSNIPQVIEQLVDVPIELTLADGQKHQLIIEVANVQSYTLKVKVKHCDYLVYADFSKVTQAKIVAQNPTFLTRELQNGFAKLLEEPFSLAEDYDMQQNLCENIRFVFGPPGTGKTTYLAKEVISPMVKKNKKLNVLVLTPTNKAADVLTIKIMEAMGDDKGYENWLVRYGVTLDSTIESTSVFHGKEYDFREHNQNVIITTMARLPYDYFINSSGQFVPLKSISWDYIVVDEASMIPLVQMVYMLYLEKPKQFIIAGDPFQIEPTTSVVGWEGENIYTMVNLNAFSKDVETVPYKYDVTLLTKQYRSIPAIGRVFSELTYNGVLEHARSMEDARPLNIERYLEYSNLNIVKFRVDQYESIYRAKHLKKSSYHIYSALFAYEFVTFIANALYRANGEKETFKIGIISPYGAQAGLVDRLIASADIPRTVEVNCGTIHGFQGDECDIVIALFNPPPYISARKGMFLQRQNIVNVAISRARDYLFVLVPDDSTENVEKLVLINKLKRLIEKETYSISNSSEVEEHIFERDDFINDNAFSTGHQLVNVYRQPEKRYEVRSEESAVDIQVHGIVKYYPFEKADEEDRPMRIDEILDAILGKSVYHDTYGDGRVTDCDEKYLTASFDGVAHKFPFPICLEGSLSLEDKELAMQIARYKKAME